MPDQEFSFGFSSSLFYLIALFPAAVGAGLIYGGTRMSPHIVFYGLGVIVLGLAVLLALNAYSTNHITLRVTGDAIEYNSLLRKRSFAKSELKLGDVQKISISQKPELEPVRRKNGSDFAGLKEGWWVLRNGEKALVVLTDPQNAVYIPTTKGYVLLVSPTDANGFVAALKALGGDRSAI